jgi:hypothetical protein
VKLAPVLAELSLYMREAFCLHELLCRLGVEPDSIRILSYQTQAPTKALYAERTRMRDRCLHVTCRGASGAVGLWCVGPYEGSEVRFAVELERAIAVWNAAPEAERSRAWEASRVRSVADRVRAIVVSKGIVAVA